MLSLLSVVFSAKSGLCPLDLLKLFCVDIAATIANACFVAMQKVVVVMPTLKFHVFSP